jgi:hypothetical protein
VLARVHPSVGPPDIELHAPQLMAGAPGRLGLPFPCSDDALLVFLLYDGYEIMYDIMYAR